MSFKVFSSLYNRNFRLYWFGQVISLTGTWMHSAAQGWLVLKLTDSPFYLGLVGAAASLPSVVFSLAGGVAADRLSKRKILIAAQVVLMFLALLLAFLVMADVVTVWHVVAIAFFVGTTRAFDMPARQAFFIEMVGKENLMNAIALNSAAFNGSRVIGPSVAGLIISFMGIAACFFFNSLSFLAAIIGLMLIRIAVSEKKEEERKGVMEEFKEGMRYIFSESSVYTLLMFIAITGFFGLPYISFLPIYARDILNTGAAGYGILMSVAGAGAFAGAISLVLKGDHSRKGLLLAVSGIVFSISLLIFSFSTAAWLSNVMLFLVGWGAVSHIATANSMLQLAVPDRLRGRVMSAFTLVFLGTATLGNLAIGSLAHYVGTQHALETVAGTCLVGTLILLQKKADIIKNMG
ncbi:MAG: MFS transporter [Thermodesulfovibrionia bacterium]|nr:MFS transporter [Thermodesulfovibrionia bacterium]